MGSLYQGDQIKLKVNHFAVQASGAGVPVPVHGCLERVTLHLLPSHSPALLPTFVCYKSLIDSSVPPWFLPYNRIDDSKLKVSVSAAQVGVSLWEWEGLLSEPAKEAKREDFS